MTTPEGKIKKRVSLLLKEFTPDLYYTMPVPYGFGESTLDYIGCFNGLFFAVETKAPDGKPTPRQTLIMNQMRNAGAKVFLIKDDESLKKLQDWLAENNTGTVHNWRKALQR